MDMKACRDGRYKRSKQCYCVLSRVSCLSTLSIWRSKYTMHWILCLSILLTLVFVALTQHLIQSTMRCENCIDSVNIDSIECIRDPCLVSTVSTYMSHFAYVCKMRYPLNLVLESWEYLWFYWTFCIVILDYGLKLHKLSNHTLVMLQKWLEIH